MSCANGLKQLMKGRDFAQFYSDKVKINLFREKKKKIPCLYLFLQVTLNLFPECFYVTVLWTKWIWLWNFVFPKYTWLLAA